MLMTGYRPRLFGSRCQLLLELFLGHLGLDFGLEGVLLLKIFLADLEIGCEVSDLLPPNRPEQVVGLQAKLLAVPTAIDFFEPKR